MARIRCYLLVPIALAVVSLRRYAGARTDGKCTGRLGWHNAETPIGEIEYAAEWNGFADNKFSHDDPRWPARCDCGYEFTADDQWQHDVTRLSEVSAPADHPLSGQRFTHERSPVGAVWWAPWYAPHHVGFDGQSLVVKTPGGDWLVDSEASNCDRKGDKTHRCWVRHGEAPAITVDKSGGLTCGAGAGSIQIGGYHGYLRDGWLEDC